MKISIVRKAPYRLPNTSRLVWCIVLAECQGLSLLFIRSPDKKSSHQLTIGTETAERIFESVNVSTFPLDRPEMMDIAGTLAMIGDQMVGEEFMELLKSDGLR
ncbi:MAG: hypothetical protein P4L87_00940 [Formivibrio sp.]|nr:hypothetical protein [Formivibrio sp.]